MARIRTIKPGFFRHERLYDAERETKMPLRIAFAGLWTAADKEGRFRWSPRQLKLDCLPYDEIDFSRVLDALCTRGFVVKYEVDGEAYGAIPSWKRHQFINNRETESDLPEPSDINTMTREARESDATATREVHAQGEGKGRGKEEGRERNSIGASRPKKIDLAEWNSWTADDFRYAEDHHLDPQRVAQDIHDWAANAPPTKRRKKNPSAFWQQWCRREADKLPATRSQRGPDERTESIARGTDFALQAIDAALGRNGGGGEEGHQRGQVVVLDAKAGAK